MKTKCDAPKEAGPARRCGKPVTGNLTCTLDRDHGDVCWAHVDYYADDVAGMWRDRAETAERALERERAFLDGYRQALDEQNTRAMDAVERLLAPILRRLS